MGKNNVLWSDSVWVSIHPAHEGAVCVGKSPEARSSPTNQTSVWSVLRAPMFCSQLIPLNLLPWVFASSRYLKISIVFQSGFQIVKVVRVLGLG